MERGRNRLRTFVAGLTAFFVLALALAPDEAPANSGRRGGRDFTYSPGVDRQKLDAQPDYEKTMREGAQQVGASIECTSGYRSEKA